MKHTREEIIVKLQEFYRQNGYLPSKKDLCPPPDGMPWYQIICKTCGRFEDVLKEAFGEEYPKLKRKTQFRHRKKHRQEMRKLLKKEYWNETLRLGYPPTIDQVDANRKMHSKSTYSKYWNMYDLLKELNLDDSYHCPRSDGKEYTKEYLLRLLQEKFHRDQRVPTYRSVTEDYHTPSGQVYTEHFKCEWDKILRLAGIKPVTKNAFHAGLTNEQLIAKLRKLARLLGHTPTMEDVNRSIVTPRSETYCRRFGSFYQALLSAELKPSPHQERAHKGSLVYWQNHPKSPA